MKLERRMSQEEAIAAVNRDVEYYNQQRINGRKMLKNYVYIEWLEKFMQAHGGVFTYDDDSVYTIDEYSKEDAKNIELFQTLFYFIDDFSKKSRYVAYEESMGREFYFHYRGIYYAISFMEHPNFPYTIRSAATIQNPEYESIPFTELVNSNL